MKPATPHTVEVCFSPKLYADKLTARDFIVVVADILRASTSICNAFTHGVQKIIPVRDREEAREYKNRGFRVAAEQDGTRLDFADFGNSPLEFTGDAVAGMTLVFFTTNGTRAIEEAAADASGVAIGSFINFSAVKHWLIAQDKDIVILCAGWRNRFGLEDAIFAGVLSESLISAHHFTTTCDAAAAAIDLWNIAKFDLPRYLEKASHRVRLRNLELEQDIATCFEFDLTEVVPVVKGKEIVKS